jgi:integrase
MSKRGNNEGSIFKRIDGRWCAVVTVGYANGKIQRKYVYAKDAKGVRIKQKEIERNMERGIPVFTERQTVQQFLERWLEDCVKPTKVPSTYKSYAGHVRHHFVPSLGRIQLTNLTAQHVQRFLKEKLASGLSPRTVQYLRSTLHIALHQAMKWDLVHRNVVSMTEAPRVPRFEITPFTPEQARVFLDAVKGDRLEALYTVAMAMGLRQGEALGLRWHDVDLEAGILSVRYQLQRVDKKLQLVEPKTSRSRRQIGLPLIVVEALREHKLRQLRERHLAGTRWQEWGLVFTSTIGTPLDASTVTRIFKKTLKENGLPPQRFHDLRHCCASLLLAQGVHARVVMEILGHSTIGLTMNTYSHVMPTAQREAANSMDAILQPNQ